MASKAWQLGSTESFSYKFYDSLRKRLNYKLVDFLLNKPGHTDRIKVLEAGSGPAFASSILSGRSTVELSVAMDIDLEALREARRRDPSLSLVVADLNALPFRTESLHLCWNSSTVEHLPTPQTAVKEMSRITRQDGFVFVGVPNIHGPLGFQCLIPKTSVGIWIGETFSLRSLKELIIGAGLTPEKHIHYFFRFFVGVLARKKAENN